jgi:CHAP domain-containing protein
MSLEVALSRIAELQSLLQPKPVKPAPTPGTSFQGTLQSAQAGLAPGMAAASTAAAPAPAVSAGGTPAGQAIVNLVRGEVGQAEQPPGSNDSPRIAQYRQATAGSGVGPWCAYFTSWAAREAGVPLGDQGQGFGRVDDVYAWAQRSGKAIPAGSGPPQPGDLIVWDEHIGVVEAVLPDGRIQTIEGNSSDQVSRRVHDTGGDGAIGYVRLG